MWNPLDGKGLIGNQAEAHTQGAHTLLLCGHVLTECHDESDTTHMKGSQASHAHEFEVGHLHITHAKYQYVNSKNETH